MFRGAAYVIDHGLDPSTLLFLEGCISRNLPIRATRLRTVIPCALRRARDDGQGLRRRLQRIRIERQVAQALASGGEDRVGHCSTDNGCRSFTNATWSFCVLNQVRLHHWHLVDTHRQIAVEIALLDASILESD